MNATAVDGLPKIGDHVRKCMCCTLLPADCDEDLCHECLNEGCTYCFDCEDWHPLDEHF